MSLDPPAYISSLQNNIRARPISWEGAVRAKTITEEDLKKIKAIDKVRKEQRKQIIEGDVKTYTQLLLGGDDVKSIFESAAKRTDILQYMLVLAGDLVDGARYLTAEHSNYTANTLQTSPNSHSRSSSTLNPSSLCCHC
jgi:V-type H+-transporting ATPase subunit H